MARPKKKASEKKTHRLPHMRCTSVEYQKLEQRVLELDISISEYVREMVFNGKVIIRKSLLQDNDLSFFEQSLIHQLKIVGRRLSTFAHRANSSGDLPRELQPCLEELKGLLEHIICSVRFYDDYVDSLQEAHTKEDKERRYPNPIHPKLGFQIGRVGTNLLQLIRIGEVRDIRPRELWLCKEKTDILLNNIL